MTKQSGGARRRKGGYGGKPGFPSVRSLAEAAAERQPELLLKKAIYAPATAELERDFIVHKPWTQQDPEGYVRRECGNVRAAISSTTLGFSREEFDALPKLEILAFFSPTYDLVDLADAEKRGVAITYTPDSTAEPVADLAMGMVVAVMRRLCEADRFVRAGGWPREVFDTGREVHGKTLGIVGMGKIGRQLAKRAAGFDMSVCYYGPHRKEDVAYSYFDDLESMARHSDCLVVTCPLTPFSRNLVDARILAALGPEGFFVNVARGPIVDEQALIEALAAKKIAGAGLDVFRDEPHVPAELRQMDNVVLAPHMGTSTREVREGRTAKLLADLRAHFAGNPLTYRAGST